MARVKPGLLAFNAGSLSERSLTRTDLDIYSRSADEMINIFPVVEGGMHKAPGTKHLFATKDNADGVLLPFVYGAEDNLVVEITSDTIRFIEDGSVLTLVGADATLGSWSDESAAVSAGGGSAPGGGSGGDDLFNPDGITDRDFVLP